MRRRLLVLACALGAIPTTAISQPSDFSLKDTRRIMADYAKCVVARHPAQASQALLNNADNRTILTQYKVLIDGQCLVDQTHANSKMSFAGDLFRYALADALVAREFGTVAAPDISKVPALDYRPVPDPPAAPTAASTKAEWRRYDQALKSYNEAMGFRALAAFGECVARLDPANSRALILSKPTSNEENSQFGLLKPALAECVPAGQTLSFGKLVLRGTIAANYYRLAHAAAH
jgi:hypothetical protein